MKTLRALALSLGAFPLTACATDSEHVRILAEIIKTYFFPILGQTLGWTVLAGFAGLFLAFLANFAMGRMGAYRCDWPHAKWVRWTGLACMLILLPILGAGVGFYEGLYRAGRDLLTEGSLPEKVYPQVGGVGADLATALYLYADSAEIPTGRIEAFRDGKWELDVGTFATRVQGMRRQALGTVADPIKEQARARFGPAWSGLSELLVDQILEGVTGLVIQESVESVSLDDEARVASRFMTGLARTATASGNPRTVTHAELSGYLTEALIVESLLASLRPFVRGNQIALLLLVGLTLATPPAVLRGIHAVYRRWEDRCRTSEATPPTSEEPLRTGE